MWVKKSVYKQNLLDLETYKEQAKMVPGLQWDTTRLNQLVRLKDQAFLALKKKSDDNNADYDTIRQQQARIIALQDKEIIKQKNTIEKLQTKKVSFFRQVIQFFAGVGVGFVASKL